MKIYQDGIHTDRFAEDYKITKREISNKDILNIKLASSGAWSAILSKK